MITNTNEYVKEQYNRSSNLDIRIQLHERYSTNTKDWHEWVFEAMPFQPESRIIEFGCGTGALWAKNSRRLMDTWQLTLTDFSEGMLDTAKQAIGERANVTYKVMNIQAIDEANDTFDAAVANHMLYHVPEVDRALAEIRRVLKPGGVFYAAANGEAHMQEIYDFISEFDPTLPFHKPQNFINFGLENGEAQLSPHFAQVKLVRFESALKVASTQDLIDYIFSIGMPVQERILEGGSYDAFAAFIEAKKSPEGYIQITKDSGMFICTK